MNEVAAGAFVQCEEASLAILGGKYEGECGGVVAGLGVGEEALAVRGETAGFLDAELEGMDGGSGWEVEVEEGAG
jgi:hypothetical protein